MATRGPVAAKAANRRLGERLIIRLAASVPAYLAFLRTKLAANSAYFDRRRDRPIRRRRAAHPLSDAEAAVVAGLKLSGVFITSLAALGLAETSGSDILDCGRRAAMLLEGRATGAGRSAMISSEPAELMNHPAVYHWGLDPTLLRIAEAYLGRSVAYDGPLIFRTPADGREVGTRKWHLDREDRRMIKVGLYLHDVDENGGPFQILKQQVDRSDGSFTYPILSTAALQRTLGAALGGSDITSCLGAAGTLIFADTARFYHRGKPATARDRFAIFYSYFASPPRHPFFCKRNKLTRRQIAQLVDGLPAEQQAAALWRDNLSWGERLIPPSRI